MPSRKKDRGRQRKARQKENNREVRGDSSPRDRELGAPAHRNPLRGIVPCETEAGCRDNPIFRNAANNSFAGMVQHLDEEGITEFAENAARDFSSAVLYGSYDGMLVICQFLVDTRLGPKMRDVLVRKGVHLAAIRLLNQCNKSVADALGKDEKDVKEITKLPGLWTKILILIIHQDPSPDNSLSADADIRFAFAKGIGPFVMRVIDGGKRELFQRNEIWHMCLPSFFNLVFHTMGSKHGFQTMISYDGFLPFVAQASCWSQTREDIVAESGAIPLHYACHEAQRVISLLEIVGHDWAKQGETPRHYLEQIARAPISSSSAKCTESTMVGLIRMLKCSEQDKKVLLSIIDPLLLKHGFVDESVIAELIKHMRDNSSIEEIQVPMIRMLSTLGIDNQLCHVRKSDSRYAAAIRHGFLEFLINASIESFDDIIEQALVKFAWGVNQMSMHSKTSRALRGRKMEILSACDVLSSSPLPNSNHIYHLISDSFKPGDAICCNCLKEFDRKHLRFCQHCNIECYCSISCQAQSYKHGHDKFCKFMAKQFDYLRKMSVNETETKRLEVLSRSLVVNGCRYVKFSFRKTPISELKQLRDKTVVIDFTTSPHTRRVTTKNPEEYGQSSGVTCRFVSPVFYEVTAPHLAGMIIVQKIIPIESLASDSNL
ncbi:hypothetical protein ACHAWF_007519 [Thalassiosira exigua]